MSNINKQELREAAERAESDSWGYDRDEFNEALTPSTVLALLDELETAEKRIAELEAKLDSADKLQDSAFRHGLQHGFSLGQTDNQAGFEECLSAYGTGKGE
ncbi:ead/Ea22-like family protein [Enterobacter hormaechei subsp. xiangfangensis]|uniref:ead/Ea22-like family protein n=1 Tax=Enterobacter hormaechei TaxID=158836 RepID=UPI002379FFFE|nr:ead/Ea22-like family protein [Enterobacter hormaechei]MDJ1450793.1 ead/Ea22-like family protein [Enterobacter hormaechei subsp. xiangfangensis]MDR9953871.1 ead/Ea22-like family protein [Enterobacter hormaechei subsp. xiangfangensis]MDS0083778.1 ead/Ea22-like family protein [Enterobacter hormaechei subsp. xiangfangensis]MDS0093118.1 ead/Ea22-like family protein [Enterobacter hormaechei subsp. xiangfangensis]MDS0102902.1 ead/Ea22-like family protein [Enterobacter hormaechei subsp. xiangfangen